MRWRRAMRTATYSSIRILARLLRWRRSKRWPRACRLWSRFAEEWVRLRNRNAWLASPDARSFASAVTAARRRSGSAATRRSRRPSVPRTSICAPCTLRTSATARSAPARDRRTVWEQLVVEQAGPVFVEVSEAVRESLVDATSARDLVGSWRRSTPRISASSPIRCPPTCCDAVSRALESADRSVFDDSIRYDDDRSATT